MLGERAGNGPCSTPAGLKLCRHWGWEWETVRVLEAGETNCETEKCRQPQTFTRNTFIQLLSGCSKALPRNT